MAGKRPAQHGRLAHIPDDAFPRAEFGLPIVFHFQGQEEPPDTVLYPANGPDGKARERMASPVILKPLVFSDGKAVPLILRLVTSNVAGVELRPASDSAARALGVAHDTDLLTTRGIRPRIQGPELANYTASPLARSESGSALEAFFGYAKDHGFSEITR